jgi:hypothetical protein
MARGQESDTQVQDFGFSSLILMFRTSGLIGLGEIPDPLAEEARKDLTQVKHSIFLLEVLKEKTKGNLTSNEEEILDAVLYELRTKYLQEIKDR